MMWVGPTVWYQWAAVGRQGLHTLHAYPPTAPPGSALISKQQVPRGQRVTSLNITTISVHFLPPPRSRQPLFPEGEPGLSRNKAHRTPLPPEYFHFHFLVSCCCHKLKNPTRFNSQLLYCKFTHFVKMFWWKIKLSFYGFLIGLWFMHMICIVGA